MKKAVVVLLVMVVIVTGLPIMMGMSGMASCPECQPGVLVGLACMLAVLAAGVALSLALLSQRLRRRPVVVRRLLQNFVLERPPRLA